MCLPTGLSFSHFKRKYCLHVEYIICNDLLLNDKHSFPLLLLKNISCVTDLWQLYKIHCLYFCINIQYFAFNCKPSSLSVFTEAGDSNVSYKFPCNLFISLKYHSRNLILMNSLFGSWNFGRNRCVEIQKWLIFSSLWASFNFVTFQEKYVAHVSRWQIVPSRRSRPSIAHRGKSLLYLWVILVLCLVLILVRHACFRDEVYDFVGIK